MPKAKFLSRVLTLVGILIALYGIYGLRTRYSPKESLVLSPQERQQTDVELIAHGNDGSAEFYQAFLRRAQSHSASVESETKVLLQSGKAQDLIVGLKALGFFEDHAEHLKTFESHLQSLSGPIVEAALEGLGVRKSPARELLLNRWLAQKKEKDSLYWKALESLYRTTDQKIVQVRLLEKVRLALQQDKLKNPRWPFRLLIQWMPKDVETQKIAFDLILKRKEADMKAMAFGYLAQVEEPSLAAKMDGYLKSKDLQLRRSALLALPVVCPTNRWKYLAEFLQDSVNKNYLEDILQVMFSLGEGGALVVLEQAKSQTRWSVGELAKINEAVEKMKAQFRPDKQSCRLRDKSL